jgi:hypothetical protein
MLKRAVCCEKPIVTENIERIVRALDNQHAHTRSRDLEDSGYKRLADLFRGFLKRVPGQEEAQTCQRCAQETSRYRETPKPAAAEQRQAPPAASRRLSLRYNAASISRQARKSARYSARSALARFV